MRAYNGLLVAALTASLLAACGPGRKAETGTLVGAVAGGLAGSALGKGNGKIAGAMVGAFVGGVVGHSIGASLDEADRRAAMEAEFRALEYGRAGTPTRWRNPQTGHYGDVIVQQPYTVENRHCRDFAHTIYIDGRPETMRGRACRNPDGTWTNVS
ncbi:MAG: RT0821/Lpp0805 family surface protein [Hyphomicrobiales bacterium]